MVCSRMHSRNSTGGQCKNRWRSKHQCHIDTFIPSDHRAVRDSQHDLTCFIHVPIQKNIVISAVTNAFQYRCLLPVPLGAGTVGCVFLAVWNVQCPPPGVCRTDAFGQDYARSMQLSAIGLLYKDPGREADRNTQKHIKVSIWQHPN